MSGVGPRPGPRALALGGLLAAVALGPAAAGAAPDLVFYDPDASYEALPRSVQSLGEHLAARLPGAAVRAVSDVRSAVTAIREGRAAYAVVGAEALADLRPLGAVPLLVAARAGSVYFHKILVDRGEGPPGQLQRRRIAAAAAGRDAGPKLMAALTAAGIHVDGAIFLGVSKDIDALLAVAFSQAHAALMTSGSLETLRAANPAAAGGMRTVWTSGNILRAVLVAFPAHEADGQRDAMVAAFTALADSAAGRAAIQGLGIDRWVPFAVSMLERGPP